MSIKKIMGIISAVLTIVIVGIIVATPLPVLADVNPSIDHYSGHLAFEAIIVGAIIAVAIMIGYGYFKNHR